MVFRELFGLFVGGVGMIIAFNAFKMFRATTRRDEYKRVTAEVLDSRLETGSNARMSGSSTTYMPKITYEYTVEGKTYTNDNYYPGPTTFGGDKNEQQEIIDRYPEGTTVEAYYDPSDPATSFLENESRKRQSVVTGLLGGLLLLIGLVVMVGVI